MTERPGIIGLMNNDLPLKYLNRSLWLRVNLNLGPFCCQSCMKPVYHRVIPRKKKEEE